MRTFSGGADEANVVDVGLCPDAVEFEVQQLACSRVRNGDGVTQSHGEHPKAPELALKHEREEVAHLLVDAELVEPGARVDVDGNRLGSEQQRVVSLRLRQEFCRPHVVLRGLVDLIGMLDQPFS